LQDPEIILLASIPDLFVAVDGNTGIESEFHSTHAIPRHVPIDGGVFGSFIPLGYPEVFSWRINQKYFRELPPVAFWIYVLGSIFVENFSSVVEKIIAMILEHPQ
jgi:hypothetical protein